MDVFAELPAKINELVEGFLSIPLFGSLRVGLTQYTFWLIVSAILLLIVMVLFSRRVSLVPRGRFQNGMEYLVQFVQRDIAKGILGETWKKHFPFLGSLFFFILINNLVGIIPGMRPGTGTISMTAAVAIVVFGYFLACGMKTHGVIGYFKSLAPAGVKFPLNILVWCIELISTILKPITLAIRLFCNMFAGHVVMGSFAIMVSLFADPLIQELSALNFFHSLPSLAFALILFIIYVIEIFVACVQAYVFTILSAVYIQSAEAEGH